MESGDEVFFVSSVVSEEEASEGSSGGCTPHRHMHPLHSSDREETRKISAYSRFTSSPTMEDVLFGLAPPRSRPASPQSQQLQQHQAPTLSFTSTTPGTAEARYANEARGEVDAAVAGGSPCAMPAHQLPPPPRSLPELRAMTSSDVREVLEGFFVRKETFSKRFKNTETEVMSSRPLSSTAATDLLRRDRCRRLVNVSNWDAEVRGNSQWDVLLPSALLPDPSSSTTTAAATAAAPSTPTAHTLRPHQVEGIRFLWSILAEGPVGQVPAVGCILAHTMGLGKTGQVVVFLHLFVAAMQRRVDGTRGERATVRPSRVLIVIPKSTQSGWKREFATWASCFPPSYRLQPLVMEEGLRPPQRVDMFRRWRRGGGVLLIGYEALVRLVQLVEADGVLHSHRDIRDNDGESGSDARERHRRARSERRMDEGGIAFGGDDDPFTELVVCDEAHRLKSVHLHVVQALRGLHPLRRLLLTGTPLQNHLHEYWAMIDFCVHKYFSRRRFREYFIQPIESSANTRASEHEVDLARKKTFTLINEVRHFVQRVDSTPLRNELPPLHEYVVVLPPSPLQRELYRRFIQTVQNDGSQRLHFLPAVSYSGKIAAHPQLLFQMRDQMAKPAQDGRRGGLRPSAARQRVQDYWAQERVKRQASQAKAARQAPQPSAKRRRFSDSGGEACEGINSSGSSNDGEDNDEAIVISDSEDGVGSPLSNSEDVKTGEAAAAASVRASRHSLSSQQQVPLTYEELCIPPSSTYVPRLEDGVKLYTAMKLIAAAMAQQEKVLLFSLSTQLLSFFELMIAKVNREWLKQPRSRTGAAVGLHPELQRPICYCRLDGSHSAAQRAALLDDFDRLDGPDVFLLSMKAGGVGITITAATRVILVDTSFNPADDQQAIGRAYRYGQTRPVYVYRLMCYPTLEYSIFVQKLAKEWLFKTVVEESSVKRDGLAGMHLRELFSLLTRAAKVLEKPLKPSRAQEQSTTTVLHEDAMLRAVESDLLYAQGYSVFLECDDNDQYGVAEEEYYKDYCRSRLFDGADYDNDAERRRTAEALLRREQRAAEASQLSAQSKTLTSMVDDLIRSRAGTDPHLAQLLTAMGLRVDPASGQVRATASLPRWQDVSGGDSSARTTAPVPSLRSDGRSFAPSPVLLVGEATPLVVRQNPHSSRQTAVMLLDSDDEEAKVESGVRAPSMSPPSTNAAAAEIAASLAPQPYARFRPGGSPSRAVEVDSEASQ